MFLVKYVQALDIWKVNVRKHIARRTIYEDRKPF